MSCYKFANFEFYPQRNLLIKHDNQQAKEIITEPQVTKLLAFFIQHPSEVLSRDRLMSSLWQGIVEESAVNQSVAKLRRILDDDANQPKYIETVSKQGYRFLMQAEHHIGAPGKGVITINNVTRSTNKLVASLFLLICAALLFWLFSSWQSQSSKRPLVGELTPVTSLLGSEIAPDFNPHIQALVFAHRAEGATRFDLMLQSEDGATKNLTQSPDASEIRSAWSNNGKLLAWTRFQNGHCHVLVASWQNELMNSDLPISGEKLAACSMYDIQLAWSADDQYLYFNRHAWQGGPLRLYRVRIADKLIFEVSAAPDDYVGDVAFALNTESNSLLLARTQHWNASQLMSRNAEGPLEAQPWITHTQLPFWIKDLEAIEGSDFWLYSEAPEYRNIMTYEPNQNGTQVLLSTDDFISDLSFKAGQKHLLFSRYQFDSDLVQIPNPVFNVSTPAATKLLVSSSRRNWFPVLDEKNQLLYFFSDRTGQTEIWRHSLVSDTTQQLSFFDKGYRPWRMRLSPDGSQLIFDGSNNQLLLMTTASGEITPLTDAEFPDYNPQWRDNQTINFVRKTGQNWSLLNMDVISKDITDLALPGAFSAKLTTESGVAGFYSHLNLPGFWQVIAGKSTRITDKGSPGPFNQWHLGEGGLYYLASFQGRAAIWYFDFESQQHTALHAFEMRNFASYQVSDDERFIIVTKARNVSADIWSVALN